jgi:hypothetical protein
MRDVEMTEFPSLLATDGGHPQPVCFICIDQDEGTGHIDGDPFADLSKLSQNSG